MRHEIFKLADSSGKPDVPISLTEILEFFVKELPEKIPRLVEIFNKGNSHSHEWMIEPRLKPVLNALLANGLKLHLGDIRNLITQFSDPDLIVLALKANPDLIGESLLTCILLTRQGNWWPSFPISYEWLSVINMCFKQGAVINENVRRINFRFCYDNDVLEFLTLFFNQEPQDEQVIEYLMTRVFYFGRNELGYFFDHVSEDRKRDLMKADKDNHQVQEVLNSRYLQHGIPGLDIIPDDMIHEIVSYLPYY